MQEPAAVCSRRDIPCCRLRIRIHPRTKGGQMAVSVANSGDMAESTRSAGFPIGSGISRSSPEIEADRIRQRRRVRLRRAFPKVDVDGIGPARVDARRRSMPYRDGPARRRCGVAERGVQSDRPSGRLMASSSPLRFLRRVFGGRTRDTLSVLGRCPLILLDPGQRLDGRAVYGRSGNTRRRSLRGPRDRGE